MFRKSPLLSCCGYLMPFLLINQIILHQIAKLIGVPVSDELFAGLKQFAEIVVSDKSKLALFDEVEATGQIVAKLRKAVTLALKASEIL